MVLHHYCEKAGKVFPTFPKEDPQDGPYDQVDKMTGRIHKPGGLWLSDDSDNDGWLDLVQTQLRNGREDWVQDKDELQNKLQYRYEFVIDPCQFQLGRVLWLETPADLQRFTQDYGEESSRDCKVNDKPGYGWHIEWKRVKADYMGILITPFQRDLLQDPFFHWYTFDCASGCFWDTTCLTQRAGFTKMNLSQL